MHEKVLRASNDQELNKRNNAEIQNKVMKEMHLGKDLCDYYTAKVYYAWLQLLIACVYNSDKQLFADCQRKLKKCPVEAFLWEILKENFGTTGAFALKYCVPQNFTISKFLLNVMK